MCKIATGLEAFKDVQVAIFLGPRGSGKTELAANIAIKNPEEVVVVDLDVYKPYIRTRDLARQLGYPARYPEGDWAYMDSPVIPGGIADLIDAGKKIIIDLAGEETGTCPLGIYRDDLQRTRIRTYLVFNPFRANFGIERIIPYVHTFEKRAADRMFRVGGVIPNIHMLGTLDPDDFEKGYNTTEEVIKVFDRPMYVPFVAVEAELVPRLSCSSLNYPLFPVERHIFL